uniref:Putative secreted protein n=1 Tax=Anopheles triannulatus TaxID=58253 RepID=A0A2M4B5N6_9DIPT
MRVLMLPLLLRLLDPGVPLDHSFQPRARCCTVIPNSAGFFATTKHSYITQTQLCETRIRTIKQMATWQIWRESLP